MSQRMKNRVFFLILGLVSLLGVASFGFFSFPDVSDFWAKIVMASTSLGALVSLVILFMRPGEKKVLRDSQGPKLEVIQDQLQNTRFSILHAEDSVRRLASFVANTITFISQISHQAVGVSAEASTMAAQVSEGAAAMEQIMATVNGITEQIKQQSSRVEQSASAIEEITASINSVNNIAQGRSDAVKSLREVTEKGSGYLQTTDKVMEEVGQSVKAVHGLLEVINEIAARTNLLAMNAAIEAAHAGEAGRGFAVVAGEIRKLAESTSKNSGSIGKTLKALVEKIAQAQGASQSSREAFTEVQEGVDQVVQSFSEISSATKELNAGTQDMLSSVNELSHLSLQLKTGADEMRQGAQDVTHALTLTKEKTQHTASGIRQISNLTIDLTASSQEICTLNTRINDNLGDALANAFQGEKSTQGEEARQRLSLSNVMLEHLIWVARLRSLISRKDTLQAEETTLEDALGDWLQTEGKTQIDDPQAYQRLVDLNQKAQQILRKLLGCSDEGICVDEEEEYLKLLGFSKDILQILSAYQKNEGVRWSKDLMVDVPIFDRHHQSLLGLVDKLYQALKKEKTHEELVEVFNELLAYTGYHFGAEEAAFEEFGYPGCDEQKTQHRILVEKALALREDLLHGKPMVAVEVMEFLTDWVTQHIKGCDKLYSAFFSDLAVEEFLDRRRAFMEARGLEPA